MYGWNGRTPEEVLRSGEDVSPRFRRGAGDSGGGDGEMYFLVDHTARKAYEIWIRGQGLERANPEHARHARVRPPGAVR